MLENSDAVAVVVEDDEQLAKIDEIRDRCPKLEHVIRMEGSGGNAISMDELAEARHRAAPTPSGSERCSSVSPDDICTFIYTSGTTGPPKGCVISHGNYRSMLDMVLEVSVLDRDDDHLPLPAARPLLRPPDPARQLRPRRDLAYWERDPLKIIPNLVRGASPTYFPSVPRIFEKIYTSATATVEKEGGLKKSVFNWAIGVGEKVRVSSAGASRPAAARRPQYEIADQPGARRRSERFSADG